MAVAKSHEDVVGIGQGRVVFEGEYKFHTPGSINAPQGTFTLTISETEKLEASGTMKIITLWGTTTHTSLTFQGDAEFNGSTGYITVNGIGKGTMTYDGTHKRPITSNININLRPGVKMGELTVTGFGEDMPCTLIRLEIDDLPR